MQKGKRIFTIEVDKRSRNTINRSMKIIDDGIHGFIEFGENNDYPQLTELLIHGSVNAKASCKTYARFLGGMGFENDSINDIVVGKNSKGKDITIRSLLGHVSEEASKHKGFYIHRNTNIDGLTDTVHLKPFKNGRFGKPDDSGYTAKILFYDNWERDADKGKSNYKKDAVSYHLFSKDLRVTRSQIRSVNIEAKDLSDIEIIEKKVNSFKGQVYFQFFDESYEYPLSSIDASYLDCDNDAQIALYKNRQLRNNFTNKTIFRVAPEVETDENGVYSTDSQNINSAITKMMGADGDTALVLTDDINPDTGEFYKNSFEIDELKSSIDGDLFTNWEKNSSNNIRKDLNNIPAVLIDVEESKLGTTSADAITQAVNFYNGMTAQDRSLIEATFRDLFEGISVNKTLSENKNWKIKPFILIEQESVDDAKKTQLESQAKLKGSVGGVTALIQLQQSVAQGLTDLDSAVEIVKEIYGISDEVARKMIGTPEIEEDGDTNSE